MRRFLALFIALIASFGMAQATFEVGYEWATQPAQTQHQQEEPGLELAGLPLPSGGRPYVYATYDLFLFELEAVDTQFYLSPSAEIVLGDRYFVQLQFLVDAPIATLSARVTYFSSGRLEGRVGVLITPF